MESLESERLHFRAWDSSRDKEWYFTMHANPKIFYNTSKSIFHPMKKEALDPILQAFETALLCVVICKKPSPNTAEDQSAGESERIGILMFKNIPPSQVQNHCGDLGIELKSDVQGQGYGTEVLGWALRWAFQMANLHRVQLEVYEWNEVALKTYQRVGFQEEGRLRQAIWRDGRWWDEILMGVLREEWSG
ncbi:GNAT family acetyltransferase [Penicillium hispanicum]|uniref:GNAT family acetyltransferase n=1 Tax=Penicillium hispanicum TaxID=1080232 RepID=UPI00253F949F|nr:GNAT family acetyltransferase [Penicillium hispanicum]KAJ5577507.1 GNAT family acetyltransferase [Penicillium hispanicum]